MSVSSFPFIAIKNQVWLYKNWGTEVKGIKGRYTKLRYEKSYLDVQEWLYLMKLVISQGGDRGALGQIMVRIMDLQLSVTEGLPSLYKSIVTFSMVASQAQFARDK